VVGDPGAHGPSAVRCPRMSTMADREDRVLERIDKFRQRRPRLLDDVVTLAHGAGGKSSAALVDAVFLEAFRNEELEQLGDAAVLRTASGERLAFSTDSYVVSPRRFPGGSIGHVAVNGTINDLAVSGARPQWLSAAFDYNVAPFFQSFVEVKVERSNNRVRVIPYGVHGRLTWRDVASSNGLPGSAGPDGPVEWIVPMKH